MQGEIVLTNHIKEYLFRIAYVTVLTFIPFFPQIWNSDNSTESEKRIDYVSNELNLIHKEFDLIHEDRGNIQTQISNLSEKVDILRSRVADESELSVRHDNIYNKLIDLLENEIRSLKDSP